MPPAAPREGALESGTVSPALAVVALALLLSIQPITTDVYLPALPALTRDLQAPVSMAQLTLSALLLAFGCSQLFWGALSDRFGRRPILLAGLSVYAVASIGSVLAPSMGWLVAWRVLQGAAMGAAVMCARAIVRDLSTPLAGARAMSRALTGLGVIAALCAPTGGLVTEWLHWRAALLVCTLYGCAVLALVVLRLPETLRQRNPHALQPKVLMHTWALVTRSPTFLAYSLLTCATYGGLFTFLAASPFVFIEVLGLSRAEFGLALFSISMFYLTGTLLCRRLLTRLGLRRTVAVAGWLSLSGGLLMLLSASLGARSITTLLPPFYLFMLGHGIHQPCGQVGAVSPFPQAAGVASAMNGFMMMVVAFAAGFWLGNALDGSIWPLVHGVLVWGVVTATIAWTLVQRYGEPQEAH